MTDLQQPPTLISLQTADGYPISAQVFRAHGVQKAHLIVAGATGVSQKFYQAFAHYAALQGYTTLTLDYRGIGLSKPATLRGFHMHYLDWATQDIAAAVAYMQSPNVPLYMVGHSFGGHAFGLLPNHARVRAFYTFGTGAGWHGWMPFAEQMKVRLMWSVIGPLLVQWKGYLAWSKLGMGEDLPLGVYKDWKHWCRFPHYFFDDPDMQHLMALFANVRTPIIAANALDDLWAMPASRNAFMAGYPPDVWRARDIEPKALGVAGVGHMGYFRRQSLPLWKDVLQWFEAQTVVQDASAKESAADPRVG